MADDFINRINPYKTPEPLCFDLRGYAEYIKEHNISGKDVPEAVLEMFRKG